jgi:hypothetical protein
MLDTFLPWLRLLLFIFSQLTDILQRGAQMLTGENHQLVWAEFSTLS